MNNKYDILFKHQVPNSMDGIIIFGKDDDYLKPQLYNKITDLENEIWADLYNNVSELQKKYASKEFLDGLKRLSIPKNNFPDFKLISRELFKASKWELVSVAGFLTEELFFDLNAQRKFPVTDIIRKSPRFDEKYHGEIIVNDEGYTPEPDIFHDVQGHIPLLANREYSNFLHKVGILGDKIIKNELGLSRDLINHNLKRLQNFAWWTYEFGLLKKQNVNEANDIDYEIYGSGILSSQSEILNIVNCAKDKSDQSVFLPYDIDEIILTSFNYSNIQDRYYVIDSMSSLYQSFDDNQHLFFYEG